MLKSLCAALLCLSSCAGEGDLPASVSRSALSAVGSEATVSDSVRRLTAKGPATYQTQDGPVPGSKVVTIREGNAMVLVATPNADGTVTRRCVSDASELAGSGAKTTQAGAER